MELEQKNKQENLSPIDEENSFSNELDVEYFNLDEASTNPANQEEIKQFEEENNVEYFDLDAEEETTPIEGTNTGLDGTTKKDYAKKKGMAKVVADGVYGGLRSLAELSALATYTLTKKMLEDGSNKDDWNDESFSKEFNNILPEEVPAETTTEKFVQGLTKFATTTYLGGSALKGAGLTGKGGVITKTTINSMSKTKEGIKVGKILAPAINGMVGDATSFWQDKENLSNIIKNNTENKYIKEIAGWLAIEEDDTVPTRMLKQSLEGLFVNTAAAGIFKVLRGTKNYIKSSFVSAKLERKAEVFAKELAEKKVMTSLSEKVSKPLLNKASNIAKEEGVPIPRSPQKISNEEIEKWYAKKMVEGGYVDATQLSEKELKTIAKKSPTQAHKLKLHYEKETNVLNGGLEKMKLATIEVANGNITKETYTQTFRKTLNEFAGVFGSTQDALYESAKTLNLAKQNVEHMTIKKVLNAIADNADDITIDKLSDVFSNSMDVDELYSKIQKLGYINPSSIKKSTKFNNFASSLTVLEQAGLMNNPGTVFRNVITSVEMGAGDVAWKSLYGIKNISRKVFKNEGFSAGVQSGEVFEIFKAYGESFVDLASSMLKGTQSFSSKYRNSLSRQSMTYLPKEVGSTIKGNSPIKNMMKAYVKYSGVNASEKIDNFFEAMFFRGEARARSLEYANKIGAAKNLSKKEILATYKKTLKEVTNVDLTKRRDMVNIMDDIMSDNLVEYSIAKKSRDKAAEMTFRSGRGFATESVTKVFNAVPVVRPFAPFIKTGTTIFFDRFIGDLTPVGLGKLLDKNFRAVMKKGGREAQEYYSKLALGGAIMTAGASLATEGRITGDYSSNSKVRAVQRASNWQPNSLVFYNDDGSLDYVSLDNLGPLSMALKYPAKIISWMQDYQNNLKLPEDDYKIDECIASVAFSTVNSVVDETALRYFSDAFTAMNSSSNKEEFLEKIAKTTANIPLNIIPRGIQGLSKFTDSVIDEKRALQGVDDFGDELKKRFGMETFTRYDIFGRPIRDAHPAYALFGFKTRTDDKEDEWLDRLQDIGVGFSMPRNKITVNGVELEIDVRQENQIRKEMASTGIYKALKKISEDKDFSVSPKEVQKDILDKMFAKSREHAIMLYYLKSVDLQKKYDEGVQRNIKMLTTPTQEFETKRTIPTLSR